MVDGNVPIGAGMSSSAAVECASIFALNELFVLGFSKMEMVKIAQTAEHEFAGVKCGIMDQFASKFAKTAGNPLFHRTWMELKSLFGITEILSTANPKNISDTAYALLATENYSAPNLLKRFNVEMLCTSDELLDTLEHHKSFNNSNTKTACLPSLRGDTIVAFHQTTYFEWLNKLQNGTGITVTDPKQIKKP